MRTAALFLAALAVADALSAGTKAKRVLVPIADGTEEIEVVTVVDVLRRAGAEVVLASVEEEDRVVCSRGVKIEADCNIKAVTGRQGKDWDLIAIPGGMPGAERIRDSVRLHPALEKHWRAMRPLAMICATPAVARQRPCYYLVDGVESYISRRRRQHAADAHAIAGLGRTEGLPGGRRRDVSSCFY